MPSFQFNEKGESDANSIVNPRLHVFRAVAHPTDHYNNHAKAMSNAQPIPPDSAVHPHSRVTMTAATPQLPLGSRNHFSRRTMQTRHHHPLTLVTPNSGCRMRPGFSFAPPGRRECTERTMKRPAHARDCARRGAIPGRFAATARPASPNRPPPEEAAWWMGGAASSVWRIDITYRHIIWLR